MIFKLKRLGLSHQYEEGYSYTIISKYCCRVFTKETQCHTCQWQWLSVGYLH